MDANNALMLKTHLNQEALLNKLIGIVNIIEIHEVKSFKKLFKKLNWFIVKIQEEIKSEIVSELRKIKVYVVNHNDNLYKLTNTEVESILAKEIKSERTENKHNFTINELINCSTGLFAGYDGIIKEIDQDKIKAEIDLSGTKVCAWVNVSDIRKKKA